MRQILKFVRIHFALIFVAILTLVLDALFITYFVQQMEIHTWNTETCIVNAMALLCSMITYNVVLIGVASMSDPTLNE